MQYSDDKYEKGSQLVALPVIYDTKGNLVYIQAIDAIEEEYQIK